jgi:DNA-3-methyladenine glycosylase II
LVEAIVNAITCQQLSRTVGIILLNRFTRAHGTGSSAGEAPLAFPLPEQVAKLHPEQLGELGFSRQKSAGAARNSKSLI